MNFFKKNIRTIIGFIVGVILASSITVYAYSYIASDVKYTKKDGTEIGVDNALNELYNKTNIQNNQFEYIGQELTFTLKSDGTVFGYQYYLECDISSYVENYSSKTINDMIIQITGMTYTNSSSAYNSTLTYEYSYVPENGKIIMNAYGGWMYYFRPTTFKLYIK